jgi:hypothetical protein
MATTMIAQPHPAAQRQHEHTRERPRNVRVEAAPHQVVDDVEVVAEARQVRISGEGSTQKDVDEQTVGDEISGQRHDEGRQAQPGDERALDRAERGAEGKAPRDGRKPRPVGREGLDQLNRDGRPAGADESN